MNFIIGCLAATLLIAVSLGATWLIVNAIVWGIMFCFGLPYTILFGTGIWLIIMGVIFLVNILRK